MMEFYYHRYPADTNDNVFAVCLSVCLSVIGLTQKLLNIISIITTFVTSRSQTEEQIALNLVENILNLHMQY